MLGVLVDFPNQCRIAQEIGERFVPAKLTRETQLILWCGMGGSAIGGDIIATYLKGTLKIPFLVNRHYTIPSSVNRNSLVVLSSYSGDTEEVISCYKQARARRATLLVTCSGGRLLDMALRDGVMHIVIPQGLPPRCALGYLSIPALLAFAKLNVCSLKAKEIDEALGVLQALCARLNPDVDERRNLAKRLARYLHGTFPLIYGSADQNSAPAYRWRTQLAENAKMLASHHLFAEMNHNEIEAFEPSSRLPKNVTVIMLRDKSDHQRLTERMKITKSIMKRRGASVVEVHSVGSGILARLLSIIYIGDWMSFYLSTLHRVDPTPVDNISYLKRRLAQR
jgi:glucose/mannose-6-phosphate isomerase